MRKMYRLLSLEPAYSDLYCKISKLVAEESFAIVSTSAKNIYLSGFRITLATKMIEEIKERPSSKEISKIRGLNSFHHSLIKKRENRELNADELEYMAKFYLALKAFILKNKISLVLCQNDTLWHHAVAILVCKELNIEYLVSEQGLIRPHTTVLDPRGVNANAHIEFSIYNYYSRPQHLSKIAKVGKHDSWKAVWKFLCFLMMYHCERMFSSQNILKYSHNEYSLVRYFKRFRMRIKPNKKYTSKLNPNSMLLLLQLEDDSQMLVHSPFNKNQELIDLLQYQCQKSGKMLAIKKHPLDTNHYNLQHDIAYFVNGCVKGLANQATHAISVNSSAVIDVLYTETPLGILGESIYVYPEVAQKVTAVTLAEWISETSNVSKQNRKSFINYLKYEYLVHGAGYSYNSTSLNYKLKKILTHFK